MGCYSHVRQYVHVHHLASNNLVTNNSGQDLLSQNGYCSGGHVEEGSCIDLEDMD